jgi:ABC-2 type transport system ATP-binding protein
MSEPFLLKLHNLNKTFADFSAVKNLNLTIKKGEIFGFLGPNGAGKTTTIKMLTGLLMPTSGEIVINGKLLHKHPTPCKQDTGYIPDRPYLYEKLTGMEYLGFVASLYETTTDPLVEAVNYLDLFDLKEWRNQLIEGYSHGMRQKLIMTSIFMLNQPLIIVDEPMIGLDPKSARIVKELFKSKAKSGTTVFLSTHSMEIAEELCDRIGIIVKGEIKASGTMDQLRNQASDSNSNLEDIFLELTGAFELQTIIQALQIDTPQSSSVIEGKA